MSAQNSKRDQREVMGNHFAASFPQRSWVMANKFKISFHTVEGFNCPGDKIHTSMDSVQH